MGLSDLQQANLTLQGFFESVCTNQLDTANAFLEQEYTWVKTADDTNATDATAEFVMFVAPRRCKLVSANYTLNGTTVVAQGASNNATINVMSRPGITTGSPGLTLCSVTTTVVTSGGTGNWAQWVPMAFAVSPTDVNNAIIPAAGMVTFGIAKNSSGVVIGKGTLTVRVQYV